MNQAIEARRSIRKFQPDKPVTKEQLNQLLAAAMLAPSAHNNRPWEFVAVTNRGVLDAVPDIHPYGKMFKTATAGILVVGLPNLNLSNLFFPQDCSAATQNILIEATAMGLGSCWCGIYPWEERIADFAELFKIKEQGVPFCIIALGTPDGIPAQRGFFDQAKVSYVE